MRGFGVLLFTFLWSVPSQGADESFIAEDLQSIELSLQVATESEGTVDLEDQASDEMVGTAVSNGNEIVLPEVEEETVSPVESESVNSDLSQLEATLQNLDQYEKDYEGRWIHVDEGRKKILTEGDKRRMRDSAWGKQGMELQWNQIEQSRARRSSGVLDQNQTDQGLASTAKTVSENARRMEIERLSESVDVEGTGNKLLKENPELRTPGAVLAGAAYLWTGRSFKILKWEDFTLRSALRARDGSAQLAWATGGTEGEFRYSIFEGMKVDLAQRFSPLAMTARTTYQFLSNTFQASVSKILFSRVDLTVRAGHEHLSRQLERAAVLSYNLAF